MKRVGSDRNAPQLPGPWSPAPRVWDWSCRWPSLPRLQRPCPPCAVHVCSRGNAAMTEALQTELKLCALDGKTAVNSLWQFSAGGTWCLHHTHTPIPLSVISEVWSFGTLEAFLETTFKVFISKYDTLPVSLPIDVKWLHKSYFCNSGIIRKKKRKLGWNVTIRGMFETSGCFNYGMQCNLIDPRPYMTHGHPWNPRTSSD